MRANAAEIKNTSETPSRAADRVVATLRERIQTGIYKTQTSLPAERALAEELQVHRRIIREAIDTLLQEKLIFRQPNCRPIIGQPVNDTVPAANTVADRRKLSSKLVALIMWHGGGPLERAGTSQRRIFWGINHTLAQTGHHTVFLDLGGEQVGSMERIGSTEQNAAREAEHLRYALNQGFGGIIFYPYAYLNNRELVQEVSRKIPVVLLDRRISGVNTDFVGIANYQATFDMTTRLIQEGHRRIAYVTRYEPIHPVLDRLQGYIDALYGSGEAVLEMILTVPVANENDSWPIVDAVFDLPKEQRPTAAICVNDYGAVLLAERLEKRGIFVPRDVALTGFDDIVPVLPNGIGLTSMAQPYEEIGKVAAELLAKRMANPSREIETVELPVIPVLRESTENYRAFKR